MNKLNEFLNLLRIHQWHKNIFVLLGFFVSGDYSDYDLLFKAFIATIAFSLASSEARELLGKFWWFGVSQEKFKVVYSDEIYKIVRVVK